MAPPKGVTPPHLRKFLFQKGHKPVGKKGSATKGSVRSSKRAAAGASPPPATAERKSDGAKGARKRMSGMLDKISEAVGTPVRPLQMGLSAGFGYILPKLLDRIGAADLLRRATGGTGGKADQYFNDYWAKNIGNIQAKAPGLADAANQTLANWAGTLSAIKVMYDGASKGKFDGKDVNFYGPLSIGQYFDAPEGAIAVAGGSGALSGVTPPTSGTSPSAGSCGWV